MKILRALFQVLPVLAIGFLFSTAIPAQFADRSGLSRVALSDTRNGSAQFRNILLANSYDVFEKHPADTRHTIIKTPTDGGIREDVPAKFKDRFDRWKAELFSTDFGR